MTTVRRKTKAPDNRRQLAALATLMGLMQTASKLSRELDAMANDVGGSLDQISTSAGIDFWDVHNTYVSAKARKPRARLLRKAPLKAKRAVGRQASV